MTIVNRTVCRRTFGYRTLRCTVGYRDGCQTRIAWCLGRRRSSRLRLAAVRQWGVMVTSLDVV